MIQVALFAALVALQNPPEQQAARTRRDLDLMQKGVMAQERAFLQRWEAAWVRSEAIRAPRLLQYNPNVPPDMRLEIVFPPRVLDKTCAFGRTTAVEFLSFHDWGVPVKNRRIHSAGNPEHWVCPNWHPPQDYYLLQPEITDERVSIDGALEPQFRANAARLREELIAVIRDARRVVRGSIFLNGQLVRMLLDQGRPLDALRATAECDAEQWWCIALAGYVHHRRGDIPAADAAFARAYATIPPATRCRWNDLRPLLDDAARAEYARFSCDARDSVNARMWWLADPLWSVPGNDRRTEQFARSITIELHAATERDSRWDWAPVGGGDALAEMVTRYGWPTYAHTGDRMRRVYTPPRSAPKYGHSLLYRPTPKGKPLADPVARPLGVGLKAGFEYSLGRAHVLPAWPLLLNPFGATNADWDITAPVGEWDHSFTWWPREHYMPLNPLIRFSVQQTAFLRRDDHALLAFSTPLSNTDLGRAFGDSVTARFVVTAQPDSFDIRGEQRVAITDRVVYLERVPRGASMIGVELPWQSAVSTGARTRFGIQAPAPLRDMPAGWTGISEPIVLVAPTDGGALPVFADSAIARMAGSTTFLPTTRSIGVYWETYGFAPTDSVDVSVAVRGPGSMSVSWKEPSPERITRTIAGTVPIQMRSVVLSIAALPAGTYQLDIAVKRPGTEGVRSSRPFVVR